MSERDTYIAAERSREKRLRRSLLSALNMALSGTVDGWATGRYLFDCISVGNLTPGDRRWIESLGSYEAERRTRGFLRYLVSAGYAEERDDRERRTQELTLDLLSYHITGKGQQLIEEAIAPDPMIDDDRV